MIRIKQHVFRRVLVDAGPLVAIYNKKDQYHRTCHETLGQIVPPLLTSWLAIGESAYLLRESIECVESLMSGPARGMYRILPLTEDDLPAMAALIRKYRKLGPQLADISLVHLADREKTTTVFTLDYRDFSVYRTASGRSLQLLPETSKLRPR